MTRSFFIFLGKRALAGANVKGPTGVSGGAFLV